MDLTKIDYYQLGVILWNSIPYICCAFVFLTLIPKSLRRICEVADANYEANRYKYHRCYGPEFCCHNTAEQTVGKVKTRKIVKRSIPKKQSISAASTAIASHEDDLVKSVQAMSNEDTETLYKRQVQTNINVNKIAQMFENANSIQRKINRVLPTVLPPERRRTSRSLQITHQIDANDLKSKINNDNGKLRQMFAGSTENSLSRDYGENYTVGLTTTKIDTYANSCRSDSNSVRTSSSRSPASSPASRGSSAETNAPIPLQLSMKSSVEDLFAAIARNAEAPMDSCLLCNNDNTVNLPAPVTSIDDILAQRRLSRPLSAYSISDLLNEEHNISDKDANCLQQFLQVLNKA